MRNARVIGLPGYRLALHSHCHWLAIGKSTSLFVAAGAGILHPAPVAKAVLMLFDAVLDVLFQVAVAFLDFPDGLFSFALVFQFLVAQHFAGAFLDLALGLFDVAGALVFVHDEISLRLWIGRVGLIAGIPVRVV